MNAFYDEMPDNNDLFDRWDYEQEHHHKHLKDLEDEWDFKVDSERDEV